MNSFIEKAKRIVSSLAILGLIMPGSLGQTTLAYHGYKDPSLQALQVPPGGTTIVTLTIQDSAGNPVKNAGVNVHPSDFKYGIFANSDASGVATVKDFATPTQAKSGDALIADVFPPFDSAAGLISPPPTNLGTYTGSSPLPAQTIKFKSATKTLNITAKTAAGVAVTTQKINLFKLNGGFAQVTTDSAGKATVKLSSGQWNVHAEPGTKFVMSGPTQVSFAEDETAQTLELTIDNFIEVNATIKGTFKTPDGSALPQQMGVGINCGQELGYGGPVQSNGTFSLGLPGDRTCNLNAFVPPNPNDPNAKQYGVPTITPFTVKAGETLDLSTITLVEKKVEIKIEVENGSTGMQAFAFKMSKGGHGPGGGEFSNASLTAGADGVAKGTIKVIGGGEYGVGEYGVMVMTDAFGGHGGPPGQHQPSGTPKVIPGGPEFVTPPATVKKKAVDAKATIQGRAVNKNTGTVLSDAFGGMEIEGSNLFLFANIERGTFKQSVPAGTYRLQPMFMMGGFMQDSVSDVTVVDGETKTLDVNLVPTNATFNVKYVDDAGKAITGIFAHAFANRVKDGVRVMGDFVGHGGAATQTNVRVTGPDEYRLGAFVEPGSGYAMIPPKDKYTIASGESKEVKVTLKPLNCKVTGTVSDPDKKGVAGAFVRLDNGLDDDHRDETKGPVDFFEFGGQTDKDGKYTIPVVCNETHNIRVFLPPDILNKNGWLSPTEAIVKFGTTAETKTADFKFRKSEIQITGFVKDDKGNPIEGAFVSGYADDGAVNQATTSADGKYTMNASKGTLWHLDSNNDLANGSDAQLLGTEKLVVTKDVTAGSVSQDLSLATKTNVLPADITRTGSSNNSSAVTLTDGFNVQFAADSLDKDNDGAQVTITVAATSEMPNIEGATVVGTAAYDVTASASGEDITSLNSPMTMVIPYKEADVTASGVKETDLLVSSYDSSTGAFRQETGYTIDTGKNQITLSASHLTLFAITASADTTPPAEVKDPKATAGDTKVTLGWTNPSDSDFNGIEIYRSEDTKSIGSKIKTTAKADTSYENASLTNGKAYYYTFKSVDATGNVSPGTNQVVATPSATAASSSTSTETAKTLPKTGVSPAIVDAQRSTTNNWFVLAGLVLAGIGVLVLRRRMIR